MARANTQFAIAVHILAVLGCHSDDQSQPVTSALLASSVNAGPSFVRRTLSVLSKAGLVRTSRGASGSCTLAKPAEDITLLEIYRAVDAPKVFALHSYPPQEECTVSCRFHKVMNRHLESAQESMESSLAQATLVDLIQEMIR